MSEDKDKTTLAEQPSVQQYPQAESCPQYGTASNYKPGDDPHPVM